MYCVIMEPHASCTCSMQPPSSRHYGCHLPCLSRPTCRFRHSSAAHRRGRGRSRTLRSCAEANAVAARGAAVPTATPTFASPATPNPPAPPRLLPSHTPAAPTVRHGSRRTPNAVPNAILYLPGRICPLCSGGGRVLDTHTCVRCSYRCSMGEWGACRSQDCVEAGMCARTGIDAYRFVALSHETVMTKC